jgi:hypothetical protein
VNGVDQAGVGDSESEEKDGSSDDEGDSSDDGHPPAGGKKIPANGKRRRGQQGGRGLKRSKATREEELIENVGAQRLELEKEKLEYSKTRDARELEIAEKKEDNRHQEALKREERERQREDRLDRELELRLKEFECRMKRMEQGLE